MKKKTVASILYAINIFLALVIVILIVMIVKRGPMPEPEENPLASISGDDIYEEVEPEITEPQDTSVTVLVAIPTSTSSVNVRSGPSTDYQRIGSAYSDYDYEVVVILDNGWTEVIYDGQNGYISSEYLMYKTKTTYTASDAATYMEATEEEIAAYRENPNSTDDALNLEEDGSDTTEN